MSTEKNSTAEKISDGARRGIWFMLLSPFNFLAWLFRPAARRAGDVAGRGVVSGAQGFAFVAVVGTAAVITPK